MERILNPLSGRRSENVLLIAAIKLITTEPDVNASSTIYCSLKRSFLEVELSGSLTFRTLQALVLVAIYELGQAIYPSAYLTVGYCARYGIALGIDRTIDSLYSSKLDGSEEERRTWWTIILLDRYGIQGGGRFSSKCVLTLMQILERRLPGTSSLDRRAQKYERTSDG